MKLFDREIKATRPGLLVLIAIIVIATLIIFTVWVRSRAIIQDFKVSSNDVSLDNSYVYTIPLEAAANGRERMRVKVLALTQRGYPATEKILELKTTSSVFFAPLKAKTDPDGKAYFDLVSTISGSHKAEIIVGDRVLVQTAILEFRPISEEKE